MVGLATDRKARQFHLRDYVTKTLLCCIQTELETDRLLPVPEELVDILLAGRLLDSDDKRLEQRLEFYRDFVPFCIDTFLAANGDVGLFAKIFSAFKEASLASLFLEILASYILDDKVKSLPVEIMQQFVEYHRKHPRHFDRLEQCIMHIDPLSLDVHQIVKLCREANFYNGLIYVYNSALQDFISPIIEMLEIMNRNLQAEELEGDGKLETTVAAPSREHGYKLFVYLAFILLGKAFPNGSIPEDFRERVLADVYGFLLSPVHCGWPNVNDIVNIGSDLPYPYLQIAVRFDSKELFKTLSLALEHPCLERGISVQLSRPTQKTVLIKRQSIVDILLRIFAEKQPPFAFKTTLHLYSFIAKSVSKYQADLSISRDLLKKMLSFFTRTEAYSDPLLRDECQAAVEQLNNIFSLSAAEEEKLVLSLEAAKYWRACDQIYRRQRKFDKVLECLIVDDMRRADVLPVLTQLLSRAIKGVLEVTPECITVREREDLRKAMFTHIVSLIDIDGERCAMLVQAHFPLEHTFVLSKLQGRPILQLNYLRGLFERPIGESMTSPANAVDPAVHERFIELMW